MTPEELFLSVLANHKGIIFKVANLYCKQHEDRKDLIQEITFQLWKSFPTYNPEYRYSTWIYRIALNVAISFYRKSRSAAGFVPLEGELLHLQESPSDLAVPAELDLLQQFIQELPELDRALILLFLEERSYREISEILGISESNVGTKINRIKKTLSQRFSNNQ